jgi:hypothetical protein
MMNDLKAIEWIRIHSGDSSMTQIAIQNGKKGEPRKTKKGRSNLGF